ncbi:MAG: hypothetical protein ACREIC_34350 [Limisphaerales bacterium]
MERIKPQKAFSVPIITHQWKFWTAFCIEWAAMTNEQVQAAVRAAIECLQRETPALEFHDVHERSTAHRLAVHMEPHFCDTWNVDCEYDRDVQLRKILGGVAECDGRTTDAIVPDIIVHHRGFSGRTHNLLVIELKKNAAEDACYRKKLELLTRPDGHYGYQLGLYINIDDGRCACTWYKDGEWSD